MALKQPGEASTEARAWGEQTAAGQRGDDKPARDGKVRCAVKMELLSSRRRQKFRIKEAQSMWNLRGGSQHSVASGVGRRSSCGAWPDPATPGEPRDHEAVRRSSLGRPSRAGFRKIGSWMQQRDSDHPSTSDPTLPAVIMSTFGSPGKLPSTRPTP
ncbi:hypothetical protein E4U53_002137 [Claviceps sorghi]|nr:hypothetical protein E4U53_002137 [Claviceps sorghi]